MALVVLIPLNLHAQGNYREEYEKFKNQAVATYTNFREQCNQEYVEFLKQAWIYYQVGPIIEKPKEEEIPPIVIEEDRDKVPIEENELPYDEVIPIPEEDTPPQPLEPVTPVPVIQETWFEFDFFNTPMKVRAEEKNQFKLKSIEGEDIAKVWERLSGKEYDNMLVDCLKIRDDYKLGDWAYLLMLLTFSDALLQKENEAILLTAYLYCQSGYQMRLGVTNKEVCFLFGSKHQIYGVPYYSIDGTNFYLLKGEAEELLIANYSFQGEKGMSLILDSEPVFARNESEVRQFASEGYKTTATCSINKNLLEFFDAYPVSQLDDNPMTCWAMYANTPLDSKAKEQLYPALSKAIAGKSKPQAADILLDFVQTAFEYEYDDKVWGGDRAFFAEESLFYPYCDCEDRSILYSRLVRDLLGLDVILVYYPGHLATAIKFNEEIKGDYISLNKEKYLVCDPTYIGAPIGVTMPEMDNQSAKVILLKR